MITEYTIGKTVTRAMKISAGAENPHPRRANWRRNTSWRPTSGRPDTPGGRPLVAGGGAEVTAIQDAPRENEGQGGAADDPTLPAANELQTAARKGGVDARVSGTDRRGRRLRAAHGCTHKIGRAS